MTAVITASRWNATRPRLQVGQPDRGHRRHSPPHHGPGNRPRPRRGRRPAPAVRLRPAGRHPGRPRAWCVKVQTPPACSPVTAQATGALCAPRTTTPTTRPSAAGSASSAPTTSDPPACGSSPTPRPRAPWAPPACAPATPPPCFCPPNTDDSPAPYRRTLRARHEAPFHRGRGLRHALPSAPPDLYATFHTRAPKGALRPPGGTPRH